MNNFSLYGYHNPFEGYFSPLPTGGHLPQQHFTTQPYSGYMMNMPMPMMQTPFSPYGPSDCISQEEVDLLLTFRILFEEHVSWTRMVIQALVFNLPNTNETVARLLRNADDSGKVLQQFYGPKVGSMFRDLMREHLTEFMRQI